MKLYIYKITYSKKAIPVYVVHAKDAADALVMGEVWGKRWNNGEIIDIECLGIVKP